MASSGVNVCVVCSVWPLVFMFTLMLQCGADITLKEADLLYPSSNTLPIKVIEQLRSLESGQFGEETCIVNPRHVNFTRSSEKNGFHRDIHSSVTVSLEPPHRCSACEFLMIEDLPRDLFVDVYQIAGEVAFGGPKVLSPDEIDLEKPAYLSPGHTVLVYPQPPGPIQRDGAGRDAVVNLTAKLPLHLRYQRPSPDPDTRSVRVSLPAPHLLMKCQGEPMESSKTEQLHKAPCDATSGTTCLWQLLPREETKLLHFEVPVGQEAHAQAVTVVTILAALVGTAVLLVVMVRHPTHPKPD